ERSGSFQTETSTTSSRLSRNSVMCLTSSSSTGPACEQPTATASTAIHIPTTFDMLPPPASLGGRDRTPPGARAMPAPAGLAPLLPPLGLQSLEQASRQSPLRSGGVSSGSGFLAGERAYPPQHAMMRRGQAWLGSRYLEARAAWARRGAPSMFRTIAAAAIV